MKIKRPVSKILSLFFSFISLVLIIAIKSGDAEAVMVRIMTATEQLMPMIQAVSRHAYQPLKSVMVKTMTVMV